MSLAKLDLSKLLQSSHLPLNERIVVGIDIGGNEATSPVHCAAKLDEVFLPQLWEEV